MNDSVIEKLKGGLIVSCQSEGNDPFNESPSYMSLFARAAFQGGAIGFRSEGIEKIRSIKNSTSLPVIGLLKNTYDDGLVRITGSFDEVEQLISVGTDIIAIDGTYRKRDGNYTGPEFIKEVKNRYGCLVLADIATCEEAIVCEANGADAISTTLSGYTPDTLNRNNGLPDYDLLKAVVSEVNLPVFAEGRYNIPVQAREAMALGAFSVIVGTAITRPRVIASWFVEEIKKCL